jgi:hypothetical protein
MSARDCCGVVVRWKVLVVACGAKLSVEDAEQEGRHRGRSSGQLRFHRPAIGEAVRRHRDSSHLLLTHLLLGMRILRR